MLLDFEDCSAIWNASIKMKSPTVGDVCRLCNALPTQVFSHSAALHYIRNNIVFSLAAGHDCNETTPVQAMLLITKAQFFMGPTNVTTHAVPKFRMLDIQLPDSPKSVLEYLCIQDKKNVKTATSINRWEIFYGDSVSLMFNSPNPSETQVEKSTLAMIKYYFAIPYKGTLSLTINPRN